MLQSLNVFKASKETGNQFFQYIWLQEEQMISKFTEAGAKKTSVES